MTENYKIVSFVAENLKRLKVVKIEPGDDPLVQITGRNGQGKTSVLDGIWWALTGTENIQAQPIRKGEDEARIELNLGGIIVRRTFKRKGDKSPSTLTIESAEGARYPQPQTMLNTLLDHVALDPLAFMRKDDKGRFDALRSFVPGIDFAEIARKRQGLFDRRTDVNRVAKREAAAAELIKVSTDTVLVDETALVNELTQATEHNAMQAARRERRAAAEERLARYAADVATCATVIERFGEICAEKERQIAQRHERERAELQARQTQELSAFAVERAEGAKERADDLETATKQRDELQARLAAAEELPDDRDVTAIRARLDQAKAANRDAAAAEQKRRHAEAAKTAEQESASLTLQMEELDAAKAAAIASAKLPVEGLDFGDGVVLFNGVPLDQASDAEQLRVSVALAMAGSPKLRVIRIRDGSLLDDDAMKLIADMAREKDYQVWIERVDGSGKVGFVLEDGAIVHRPSDDEVEERLL